MVAGGFKPQIRTKIRVISKLANDTDVAKVGYSLLHCVALRTLLGLSLCRVALFTSRTAWRLVRDVCISGINMTK